MTRRHGLFHWWVVTRAVLAVLGIFAATFSVQGQSKPMPGCPPTNQPAAASAVIQEIRRASFPELARVDLRVRAFRSQSDYFRTRFSLSRFLLLMPMRYFVDVNPALLQEQAPSDGVCAILAHELAHVISLSHDNRIRRFGLVRLLSTRHTMRFERGADLEAIHRGYGDGLKSYRAWVYAHIPSGKLPEKLRNYFSPEEIAAIQLKWQERPELFEYWRKHVPLSLPEIQSDGR